MCLKIVGSWLGLDVTLSSGRFRALGIDRAVENAELQDKLDKAQNELRRAQAELRLNQSDYERSQVEMEQMQEKVSQPLWSWWCSREWFQ